MRNPNRIPKILDKLKELWTIYPDQRFLQLLYNYILPHYVNKDIFFIEDDDIEEVINLELVKHKALNKTMK